MGLKWRQYFFRQTHPPPPHYAPSYVKNRFEGVFQTSLLNSGFIRERDVIDFLIDHSYNNIEIECNLIVWGYGIGVIDFKCYFTSNIENLDTSNDVLEAIRLNFLSNEKINQSPALLARLQKIDKECPPEIKQRSIWPFAPNGRVNRMTPYAISAIVFADSSKASAEKLVESVRSTASKFCGAEDNTSEYRQMGVHFHLAGYDGQFAVLEKRSSYLAESLWRLCAIYWASMKECDFQLARKSDQLTEGLLSQRALRHELFDLQRAMNFFHALMREGSAEAMADYELERVVYAPTWASWDGDKLAKRLAERMKTADYIIRSKKDELRERTSRTVNILLFFIAILSTSPLASLTFKNLVKLSYLSQDAELAFHTAFLVICFFAALVFIMWPRRL